LLGGKQRRQQNARINATSSGLAMISDSKFLAH